MKLVDFIICDDIRQEVANKVTLVGVYNEKIEFASLANAELIFPLAVKLGFYIRCLVEPKDVIGNRFELIFAHDGEELTRFVGPFEAKDRKDFFSFTIGASAFPIKGPGMLRVKLNLFEDQKLLHEIVPSYGITILVRKTE